MKKYQVISIDCMTNVASILKTFINYNDCCEYVNNEVVKGLKPDDYLKCYLNGNMVSVFKYFYVYPKRLVQNIQIIEYEDVNV